MIPGTTTTDKERGERGGEGVAGISVVSSFNLEFFVQVTQLRYCCGLLASEEDGGEDRFPPVTDDVPPDGRR